MTSFALYKTLFTFELLVAEFLFTFRLKKRKYYWIIFPSVCLVLLLCSAFIPIPKNDLLISSVVFFLTFCLSNAGLLLCYEEKISTVFFCALAGYSVQHFSYELSNLALGLIFQIRSPLMNLYQGTEFTFSWNLESFLYGLIYFFCYLIGYSSLFLIFGRKIKKGSTVKIKNLPMVILIFAGLIIDILLNLFTVFYDKNFLSNVIAYATNLLCCILLLYSQFSLLKTKELESEIDVVKKLHLQEEQQYKMMKENINLLNIKCHDMKHQIHEIGQRSSISNKTLSDIEHSIKIYDSMVKTGNEALDVILTEKSLICGKEKISLSIIADGASLLFMEEGDIYSLFGNALDNAIDALKDLTFPDKKVISLKVRSIGNFISINISNYCDKKLNFDKDGLPTTTKEDKNYHGFGMKSISYIVDKYKGDISVSLKDNMFNLNILFPK